MTEKEWFRQFKRELSALPRAEREAAVQYYRELFGDRSDGGEREEDILASFGAPAQAAAGILAEREEKAPARSAGGAGRSLVGMLLMVFVAFPVGLAVFVFAVAAGVLSVGGVALVAGGGAQTVAFLVLMGMRGFSAAFLAQVGMGIALVGAGLLLIPILLKVAKKLFRLCGMLFVFIARLVTGKKET